MSESTEWQVYDPATKTIRDCTPDELYDLSEKVRATDPVTGDYTDLTNAEACDWPQDLEVAPTPHEWQVDGRAATPAELQDWGARVRAGQHRPEVRPVTLPSEATAQVEPPRPSRPRSRPD